MKVVQDSWLYLLDNGRPLDAMRQTVVVEMVDAHFLDFLLLNRNS
jgi:hypothetical protein